MWDIVISTGIVLLAGFYLFRQWTGNKKSCHDSSHGCEHCDANDKTNHSET